MNDETATEKIARLEKELKQLRKQVDSLEIDSDHLAALEAAGVDNWQGIEFAYQHWKEYMPSTYKRYFGGDDE